MGIELDGIAIKQGSLVNQNLLNHRRQFLLERDGVVVRQAIAQGCDEIAFMFVMLMEVKEVAFSVAAKENRLVAAEIGSNDTRVSGILQVGDQAPCPRLGRIDLQEMTKSCR